MFSNRGTKSDNILENLRKRLQGGAMVGTVSSQGVCSQILSSWQLG